MKTVFLAAICKEMIIRFWYCDAILYTCSDIYLSVICSLIVEHMHANRKSYLTKLGFYNVSSLYWSEKQYYKVCRSIQTVLNWTNHDYLFESWRLGFRAPEPRKFPEIRCNGFFLLSKVRECFINKNNEQLKLLCFAPFKSKKV